MRLYVLFIHLVLTHYIHIRKIDTKIKIKKEKLITTITKKRKQNL